MTTALDAFLDAFAEVLDLDPGPLTAAKLKAMIKYTRAATSEHPAPALGWSEWLEWAGGPCPLPPMTIVNIEYRDGDRGEGDAPACNWGWDNGGEENDSDIVRFRYRCLPGGWLPRGDFVPPDVLWSPDCPVRCEWTNTLAGAHTPGKTHLGERWKTVGFIRLVAREKACELPEGWRIERGCLITPRGGNFVAIRSQVESYGHDTIRRAVDAWLASMKERGNG